VPTVAETVVPGFNSISWIGLLAPAATPKDIVEKISADLREVLAEPEVKNKLVDLGAVPRGNTPLQFTQLIGNDRKRYAQIITDRKITLD
jgi:tripartite-type tricarboxylate transporter receptor subunit TctC